MKFICGVLFSTLFIVPAAFVVPATAQTVTPLSAAPVASYEQGPLLVQRNDSAEGMENSYVLRSGTPVILRMAETLSTEEGKLAVGYLAHLEVLEPVVVNGLIAIPAGSRAFAEITQVRNKGMWGKSGRIMCQMMYIAVGNRKIRVRGIFDNKGQTGTAGVIAALAFLPSAGFFITGTSAALPFGHSVSAIIDDDVALSVAPSPTALAH